MLVILIKYMDETADRYWLNAFFLILPAVLTAAAGYTVNDIYDRETDRINRPAHCIVGVTLSVRSAWLTYVWLNCLSLIVSWFFSPNYAVINLSIIVLLFLYAVKLKGLPLIGNVFVAMCSAAVIACCIFLVRFETSTGMINFAGYIIFAFFISLIREVVKDMEDLEGDAASGLRTYPVVAGIGGAKILVYAFTSVEIVLCGVYSFMTWGVSMFTSSVIMGLITISLLYFINLIAGAKTVSEFRTASTMLKYIMLAGVINLIFV